MFPILFKYWLSKKIRMEEQLAFSDWVNTNLGEDKDLKHLLPIGSTGRSLFEKVKDGILLWYMNNEWILYQNRQLSYIYRFLSLLKIVSCEAKSSITRARIRSTSGPSIWRIWRSTRCTKIWRWPSTLPSRLAAISSTLTLTIWAKANLTWFSVSSGRLFE